MKRFSVLFCFTFVLMVASCRTRSEQPVELYEAAAHPTALPVVVFGGGVAGLTAANYMLQANIPCLVVEGKKPGGALAQSDSVRNWPGVKNAPGGDIVGAIKEQVAAAGGQIIAEELVGIRLDAWPYRAAIANSDGAQREITFLSCVIAMGAEPNYLGIPGERGQYGYWGRGVTNCAVCEGSLCKGKSVIVVGGGDAAMTEAGYLAGIASDVQVLVRRDVLRAKDTRKVAQVAQLPNVKILYNREVTEIFGDSQRLTHVKILDNKTQQASEQKVDGFFLAIGARPNTALVREQLTLDAGGYIVVDAQQHTSKAGVFAAGDIADPVYKQAVTSAAEGCKAALEAQAFLERAGYVRPAAPAASQPVAAGGAVSEFEEKRDSFILTIDTLEQLKKLIADDERMLVVDVYARLCIACKVMEPRLEHLARVYDGTVTFAKVNLSGAPFKPEDLAVRLGVARIEMVPFFVGLRHGKVLFSRTGEIAQDEFERLIQQELEKAA